MSASDTIFAVSSGSGRAAIAIVRLSGPRTADVVAGLTGSIPKPRSHSLRRLIDPAAGGVIDEAVAVWVPGPRSFTGEDCAEFHVHGSRAVLAAVFKALAAYPGVRPAEAGEFTRRAVMNGKMDLVEAEGLGDLLAASTERQRRQAMSHMLGEASSVFESWRKRLLDIRADIEAVIDFAEEEGVAAAAAGRIDAQCLSLLDEMQRAVAKAAAAESIRDGVKVVLAGLPNTGKSSLLNALAGRNAAIVSAIPGTTRDVIEVMLDIDGIPVILTDTAGLRTGADEIEREGITRARQELRSGDVILWVCSPDIEGSDHYDPDATVDLVVFNKADLPRLNSGLVRNELRRVILVSARTGAGLPELIAELTEILRSRFHAKDSAIIVSTRQKDATQQSIRMLNDSLARDSSRLEMKAECIRMAADAVGRITGRTEVEEWLGVIFAKFCIGK